MRLPDGSRKERRFRTADTIGDIFDFIDTWDGVGEKYSLVSNFPRRVFSRGADGGVTLVEGGLQQGGVLMYRSDD